MDSRGRHTTTARSLHALHGGGWVIGDLDTHDDACRFLAKHAGIRVLSVDYRLAPEHPYPAAFEDCAAAYQFALNNAAELGTAPSPAEDATPALVGWTVRWTSGVLCVPLRSDDPLIAGKKTYWESNGQITRRIMIS